MTLIFELSGVLTKDKCEEKNTEPCMENKEDTEPKRRSEMVLKTTRSIILIRRASSMSPKIIDVFALRGGNLTAPYFAGLGQLAQRPFR